MTDERPQVTDDQLGKLFRLNLIACVFQTVTGALILGLTKSEIRYLWYSSFPGLLSQPQGNPFLGPDPQPLGSGFNPGYMAGVFLLLSALDHGFVCSVGKAIYERGIKNGMNVFRWIEYSISASLMRIMVALLSGIADIHALFMIFGLTMCTMVMGLAFELENQGKPLSQTKWFSFWAGFIPHAFAWLTIMCYFFVSVSRSNPPAFVWAINIIVFTLDLTFAINLFFQYRAKGKFLAYVHGEWVFIVLSFTSKQLLAWINFQGSNRN